MPQYNCGAGKGHPSWVDMGPYIPNPFQGCPTCAQESMQRDAELRQNKQMMKEAFIEALREYHGNTEAKQG